ncbi:MAG: Gfo/Idh/MocA family oxidoreductase, partial [Acidobacteriota bacterium]
MSTTKFAIVGAGAISQGYAQAFNACDECEVVAVADIRPEAAASLADVLNCQHFTSYQQMADDCQIDAVLVCTPPSTHPEICTHFIERYVHVLCEKPFAVSVEEAEKVVDAARAMDVRLTMASKFRYVDDVIKAKQIVDSGILGDIILFENAFTARVDMSSRWNSDPTISGGGVLIDNGTHSFDIARYFLGPLAEVQVMEGKRSQGLSVEETVRIFVRSAQGVIGNIDLSWSINKELD